jgi:hypothetical protein
VVNFGNESAAAEVSWPEGRGLAVEVNQPFQPDRPATLPVRVELAPRTCAVVAQVQP